MASTVNLPADTDHLIARIRKLPIAAMRSVATITANLCGEQPTKAMLASKPKLADWILDCTPAEVAKIARIAQRERIVDFWDGYTAPVADTKPAAKPARGAEDNRLRVIPWADLTDDQVVLIYKMETGDDATVFKTMEGSKRQRDAALAKIERVLQQLGCTGAKVEGADFTVGMFGKTGGRPEKPVAKAAPAKPVAKPVADTRNFMVRATTGRFAGRFLSYCGDHAVRFVKSEAKALVFAPTITDTFDPLDDPRYGGNVERVYTDRERSAAYAHLDPKPAKAAKAKAVPAAKPVKPVAKPVVTGPKFLTEAEARALDNEFVEYALLYARGGDNITKAWDLAKRQGREYYTFGVRQRQLILIHEPKPSEVEKLGYGKAKPVFQVVQVTSVRPSPADDIVRVKSEDRWTWRGGSTGVVLR